LEVNGWSGLLFIAAGLLLLLGAPMHWGAKTMSLIVGISLMVVCLIALANGHGALGIFAANGLTELVLGATGALLIMLSLLPRVRGRTKHGESRPAATGNTRHVEPEPRTGSPGTDRQGPATADGTRAGKRNRPLTPVSNTSNESYDTIESH
jgi:hypothetical protein